MKTLRIRFDSEEELCQLLRKTLEKLPACESLQSGQGLVRRLSGLSRALPTVSIDVLDDELIVQPSPSPTSPTPTFGEPTAETFDDPDNPFFSGTVAFDNTGTNIKDPALATFGGGGVFEPDVTVADGSGKVTRQRKIPLDLGLLDALKDEKSLFGDVIAGISRGTASLLGLGNTTVSEALARMSGGDTRNVHVAIGMPFLTSAAPALEKVLIREADVSLLETNIESLQRSVTLANITAAIRPNSAQKRVIDRNRGNLEILRLQALEDEEF